MVADKPESFFFSIVMAVRNGDRFIAETLEAILNQTFEDFELIIVDDGSTDKTVEIIDYYMRTDKRIRLVSNSNLPGLPPALNCGISYAKGDWIARCDADDIWKPEKLQIQADFIQNWQADEQLVVLGTSGYNINEVGKPIGPFPSCPNTIEEFQEFRASASPFMMCHSSVVFSKEIFYRVGEYREDYIGAEDCDLWPRFSDVGVVINIDQPLFLYRKHLGSWQLENTIKQMNNVERIRENTRRRRNGTNELTYDEFIELSEKTMTEAEKKTRFRKQKSKYLYRIGAINLANGRYISGLAHLLLAIPYDHKPVLSSVRRAFLFKVTFLVDSIKKLSLQKISDVNL